MIKPLKEKRIGNIVYGCSMSDEANPRANSDSNSNWQLSTLKKNISNQTLLFAKLYSLSKIPKGEQEQHVVHLAQLAL